MKSLTGKISPWQHTIEKEVSLSGIGLHSGRPVSMRIRPAAPDTGIRFCRTDLDQEVHALMDRVVDTRLATTIGENGARVSTTEHLLAALSGMGIDNALIDLSGPEVPIMDGSSGPFVHLLKKIRRSRQADSPRRFLKITGEISCREGETEVRVLPHDSLKITCSIDFEHQAIRRQSYSIEMNPRRFVREIASARTFGFAEQVEQLRAKGLALGGSLENAVVMDHSTVLNSEGLRFSNEFVRHKVLDLIGDLALLGSPLVGHVIASRPGHALHLTLMQEIAAHPECWEYVYEDNVAEDGVLAKVVSSTRMVHRKILPFMLPQATMQIAGAHSPGGSS